MKKSNKIILSMGVISLTTIATIATVSVATSSSMNKNTNENKQNKLNNSSLVSMYSNKVQHHSKDDQIHHEHKLAHSSKKRWNTAIIILFVLALLSSIGIITFWHFKGRKNKLISRLFIEL